MAYSIHHTLQRRQPSGHPVHLQLQRPPDRWLLCRRARHSICHDRWPELKRQLLPAHVIVYQRPRHAGAVETPSSCRPRSVTCTSVSSLLVYVVHEHVTLGQYEQQEVITQCDMELGTLKNSFDK